MEIRKPDYYDRFRCLAGDCPHTCCAGWEVVIDPDSAAFYRTVPGPLGEKLQNSLTEEDGELCFQLTEAGRCPFLDGENLCELHRELGEERTCAVCRSHPRFTEDYGPLREVSLGASCPAANALLLGSEEPLAFPAVFTPEEGEEADPWLGPLVRCRETALAMLEDRSRPLRRRMAEVLLLANAAQSLLDWDRAEEMEELCGAWTPPEPLALPEGAGLFPGAWRALRGLEILGGDWRELLERAKASRGGTAPEPLLERITAYFLFRWWLKAVNDGDLLGRAQLAVFAALAVDRAAETAGLGEALRLFCREIEHGADNVEALLEAFRWEPELGLAAFLRELDK